MPNVVFLPATDPADKSYGAVPRQIAALPGAVIHEITFPAMVWYNASVRAEAIRQIRALGAGPVILVGFSKSGLGAWNIARTIPERISATIIFDAPTSRVVGPIGGTELFYEGDVSWQEDQPVNSVQVFKHAMSKKKHTLVLISGKAFHDEMLALSQTLEKIAFAHVFLPRPEMQHHWNAGWIEEGLAAALTPQH